MREKSIGNQCLGRPVVYQVTRLNSVKALKVKNKGHPNASIDHRGMGRQKAEVTNKIRHI